MQIQKKTESGDYGEKTCPTHGDFEDVMYGAKRREVSNAEFRFTGATQPGLKTSTFISHGTMI